MSTYSVQERLRHNIRQAAGEAAIDAAEAAGIVTYSREEPDAFLSNIERTIGHVKGIGERLSRVRGRDSKPDLKMAGGTDARQRIETTLFQLSAAIESLANEAAADPNLRDGDLADLERAFDGLSKVVKLLKLDLTRRLAV